jgi:hypothetical protein
MGPHVRIFWHSPLKLHTKPEVLWLLRHFLHNTWTAASSWSYTPPPLSHSWPLDADCTTARLFLRMDWRFGVAAVTDALWGLPTYLLQLWSELLPDEATKEDQPLLLLSGESYLKFTKRHRQEVFRPERFRLVFPHSGLQKRDYKLWPQQSQRLSSLTGTYFTYSPIMCDITAFRLTTCEKVKLESQEGDSSLLDH